MRVLLTSRAERSTDERGAVAIMTGVVVVMLAVIAAFSIDLGAAYKSRMELRTAADAGALAAAGVFAAQPGITDCETLAASAYGEADDEAQSVGQENRDGGVTGDPIEVECVDGALEVTYTVHGSTAQLFGRIATSEDDIAQERSATAVVDVPPSITGLRPMALCADEDFPVNQTSGWIELSVPDTTSSGGGGGAIWTGKDTDKGTAPDSLEQEVGGQINNASDDLTILSGDADADGLTNQNDAAPNNPDQDGDGILDGADSNPTTAQTCPDLASGGNWWTIRCPETTNSGETALVEAINNGCKDPVEIVPNQPSTGAAALSSHLTTYCANAALHPESCLAAQTGNFSGSPNAGAIAAFSALAQSQEPIIFPVFCGSPYCSPVGTLGANGGNEVYPVYRLLSVSICSFTLKGKPVDGPHTGVCEGAPKAKGGEGNMVLAFHTVIISGGSTGVSTCALGDACDPGARRVLMVK